jgi:hypothetical protein
MALTIFNAGIQSDSDRLEPSFGNFETPIVHHELIRRHRTCSKEFWWKSPEGLVSKESIYTLLNLPPCKSEQRPSILQSAMEEDIDPEHSSADTLDGNHLTSQDSDSKRTRNHDFSGDTRSKKDTHLEERKIFKWSHLLASKKDNLGPQTRSAWYTWGPPESHPVPTVANPEIQKLFEKREP